MSRVKRFQFWPTTGWTDQLWQPEVDVDMFARTSRRVCERYSEALASHELPSRTATIQVMVHSSTSGNWADSPWASHPRWGRDVLVNAGWVYGEPCASVTLPPGVAGLSPRERALLVLDVVDTVMRQLAAKRAWDPAALDAVRAHVMEHDLGWSWTGPAKTSRDRRHSARAVFDLLDDGFGSVVLEVRRADGELVTRSGPQLGFCTQPGFVRAARTVTWQDSATVGFTPDMGIFGMTGPSVVVSLEDPPSLVLERPILWPRRRSPHDEPGDGPGWNPEPAPEPTREPPAVVVLDG